MATCCNSPTPPCLQTKVQGTYNPLLHQVHHAMATLRLAAAGKVHSMQACAGLSLLYL